MNVNENYYHWGPLLYRNKISASLVDQLLQRGNKSNLDFRHMLAGILEKESDYTDEDKAFFAREMQLLMTHFARALNNYHQYDVIEGKFFELEDLWINYMHSGDFNPPHIHDRDFSFVIFLQVPEQIREEYESYQTITSNNVNGPGSINFLYGQSAPWFINSLSFFPEVGDIFIFPAGLYHSVAPFKSDVVRISVAGNISLKDI